MAAKLEPTRTPGIYRRGSRYVFRFTDTQGRKRQESTRTLDDARMLKAKRETQVQEGSYLAKLNTTFTDYSTEWIENYRGQGRRGFRETTRDDYRRDLNRYILPRLGHLPLTAIEPSHVSELVKWLESEDEQGKLQAEERRLRKAERADIDPLSLPLSVKPFYLADGTIRRILAPLKVCLATARGEGLIKSNPAHEIALSPRDEQHRIDTNTDYDDPDVKALTTDQLRDFILCCPPRWRTYFTVLALTGIRMSESFALRWRDLRLDGSEPMLKVRRAHVRGRFGPPKSKAGKRDIPLGTDVVDDLRNWRKSSEWNGDDDLVFPASNGEPWRQENVRRRVLKPIAEEAGVPWVGFHTFRHTCATRLFADGRNAAQVAGWLGHSSSAFTHRVYIHLLDNDLGGPLIWTGGSKSSRRSESDQGLLST